MSYKKLWIALGIVLVASFAVLGGVGVKVLRSAPPIPSQVVSSNGVVLFDGEAVHDGHFVGAPEPRTIPRSRVKARGGYLASAPNMLMTRD